MTGSHSRLGVSDRESLARGVTHAYDTGTGVLINKHSDVISSENMPGMEGVSLTRGKIISEPCTIFCTSS